MNSWINLFASANDVVDNFNSVNKENEFIVMLQSEDYQKILVLCKKLPNTISTYLELELNRVHHLLLVMIRVIIP